MPTPRKLTDEEVIEARREYAIGRMHLTEFKKRTVEALAKKHGVNRSTMYDLLHYESYHDVFEDLHEVPELTEWLLENEDEHWKRRGDGKAES